MKKLTALALAVLMLLSFAACTKYDGKSKKDTTPDEAASTATTTTAPSDEVVDPTGLCRGKVSDNVYTSSYTGISFTADSTWTFFSEPELASAAGVTENDITNKNMMATIKSNNGMYDVFANKINKDKILEATFIVSYINAEEDSVKDMPLEQYVDLTAEAYGIDVATAKTENVTYGGRTFCRITSETAEKNTLVAACRMDKVIVTISASASASNGVNIFDLIK